MRNSALVAAAFSLGVLACGPDREADVDTTTVPFDTGMATATYGGDTALREKEKAAPAPATPDGKALGAFIAASRHEIQHGRLAEQKGSTQLVRDFGKTVSRDHDDFVQRARELGTRLAVLAATQPGDTAFEGHRGVMGELRQRTGVEFDRAFLEHEIDYHRWLIDAVNQTMLPYATQQDVKTFLQQAVPTFEAHMKGAQDLLAKLPSS
jgi:putative membrane protein